jgi:CheY-like chemotaxis protein
MSNLTGYQDRILGIFKQPHFEPRLSFPSLPDTAGQSSDLQPLCAESRPSSSSLDSTPQPVPQDALKQDQRKRVVLLVEDNRADVLLVEEAIDRYELPVELHIVDDGAKAIEFIERAETDPSAPCPEVMLLDLNLPKRSGKEVLQRVRQSEKLNAIPVLVVTSSDAIRDRQELAASGATSYFRKPASYEGFLKVGEILGTLLREE